MKRFSTKLHSVSFGAYTRAEILKSSVLEVTTSLDFDDCDQPVEDGIYDSRLGPFNTDGLCGTCHNDYVSCPGHLGHFSLPVPIYNPLFVKTLHQLLLGSCLNCHSLMAPLPLSLLLRAQLVALDSGVVKLVKEMDDVVHEILRNNKGNANREVKEKLDVMLANAGTSRFKEFKRTSGFATDSRKQVDIDVEDAILKAQLRTFSDYRQELLKKFTNDHLLSKCQRCPHCQTFKPTIYNFSNVRFVYNKNEAADTESGKAKSPNSENFRNTFLMNASRKSPTRVITEDRNKIIFKSSELVALTPDEARKHLTELWEKEKRILQQLYRILTSVAAQGLTCPTDVFFLEVIPIPPPKYRPFYETPRGIIEHPQSVALRKVIQTSMSIKTIMNVIKTQAETRDMIAQLAVAMDEIAGQTPHEKLQNAWISLQGQINCIIGDEQDCFLAENLDISSSQMVIEPKDEKICDEMSSSRTFRKNDFVPKKGVVSKLVNYATRTVNPWKEIKKFKNGDEDDIMRRPLSPENLKSKSTRSSCIDDHKNSIYDSNQKEETKETLTEEELRRASFVKPCPCPIKLISDPRFTLREKNDTVYKDIHFQITQNLYDLKLKVEKEKNNRLEEKLRMEKERNSRLHLSLQKEMDKMKKIREIMRRETCEVNEDS